MASPPAHASTGTAQVTLVHGVRGLVADVWLDGHRILSTFRPEQIAGPLTVAAGPHRVQIYYAGHSGPDPLLSATLTVPAGANLSVAVGLGPTGAPTVFTFNDTLPLTISSGASLVFRDVAAAPAVSVRVDGNGIGALTNSGQLVHPTVAGTHLVQVIGPGGQVMLPPQQLPVSSGHALLVYLIGSAAHGDLGWVATSIQPGQAAPAKVSTGNSGLVDQAEAPVWAVPLIIVGCILLAVTVISHRPAPR